MISSGQQTTWIIVKSNTRVNMRRFLDLMKVSAKGMILLSTLAACQSKPESNPTPPENNQVEVIIEQVVNGKVVETWAVGRTNVVKYGTGDGSEVAYKWY